ncbi:MAG: glycosyltransferase family 4 protein [Methylotetracoccus sp.]
MKPGLLYALHSGNLYGTERMALATAQGLREDFDPVLFAPPGPALGEAQRLGIAAHPFHNSRDLLRALAGELRRPRPVAFFATAITHSLLFIALNAWFRRPSRHLHLVHGGTDERLSYGRKRWLNGRAVTLVAVSEFVRSRLLSHGVRPDQIRVIENFLPDAQIAATPRRAAFDRTASRVILVSRIDPIKRVDLLLDTLDREPALAELRFDIYGTGWDYEALRQRAQRDHPNVEFHGFTDQVAEAMTRADVLLHLCPEEPFGLAILEAIAAGVPVLVPDSGGAGALIEPDVSGFHFHANDAADLASRLLALRALDSPRLNAIVAAADARLRERYSGTARLPEYRVLIEDLLR